ncbi:MAG TPA: ABC transporter substrate-binding protein [Caulobacteraceae bacterium]|nr:ABC transporter substrate-binding protein [Caulobacteraceae bacterium]
MPSRRISHPILKATAAAALAIGVAAPLTVLAPAAALAQAPRDAGAEQFVQTQAQRVISVLNDKSQANADKIRTFRGIVDEAADVPKITTFVLGKYARTITPAQRAKFGPLFREFAQNVYETRLGDYHGETVKVTGSVVRKPGDVIVATTISGGKLSQPVQASWRVLGSGTSWKIVDVQVSGIWLAITQQQDFVSTIDNAGGNIDALIAQLENQVQQQNGARAK